MAPDPTDQARGASAPGADPSPDRPGVTWRRRLVELGAAILLALGVSLVLLREMANGDSLRQIDAEHVGVRVDHRARTLEPLTAPGKVPFLPWLQEVYVLDRRPREYVMEGNERVGLDRVPRLLVRARDGSSLGFDRVAIQYALDANRADRVLVDSGPGEAFAARVDLYARSILREAIGAYTVQELLQPDVRLNLTDTAKAGLAKALAPHGLIVLELTLSKPRFSEAFEETISRRQVADQDTAGLVRQAADLEETRQARLDKIEREMQRQMNNVTRTGRLAVMAAERTARRRVTEARAQADALREEGRLTRLERLAEAERRMTVYTGQADQMRARMESLAAQGPQSVRAALVERLSSIEFEILPWSSDEGRDHQTSQRTSR